MEVLNVLHRDPALAANLRSTLRDTGSYLFGRLCQVFLELDQDTRLFLIGHHHHPLQRSLLLIRVVRLGDKHGSGDGSLALVPFRLDECIVDLGQRKGMGDDFVERKGVLLPD